MNYWLIVFLIFALTSLFGYRENSRKREGKLRNNQRLSVWVVTAISSMSASPRSKSLWMGPDPKCPFLCDGVSLVGLLDFPPMALFPCAWVGSRLPRVWWCGRVVQRVCFISRSRMVGMAMVVFSTAAAGSLISWCLGLCAKKWAWVQSCARFFDSVQPSGVALRFKLMQIG